MPGMNMGEAKTVPAEHAASGTSVNPRSSPMDMIHKRLGSWTFMFHGVAFITDEQQSGPRGADFISRQGLVAASPRDLDREAEWSGARFETALPGFALCFASSAVISLCGFSMAGEGRSDCCTTSTAAGAFGGAGF